MFLPIFAMILGIISMFIHFPPEKSRSPCAHVWSRLLQALLINFVRCSVLTRINFKGKVRSAKWSPDAKWLIVTQPGEIPAVQGKWPGQAFFLDKHLYTMKFNLQGNAHSTYTYICEYIHMYTPLYTNIYRIMWQNQSSSEPARKSHVWHKHMFNILVHQSSLVWERLLLKNMDSTFPKTNMWTQGEQTIGQPRDTEQDGNQDTFYPSKPFKAQVQVRKDLNSPP